jgi:hypothetical protein
MCLWKNGKQVLHEETQRDKNMSDTQSIKKSD